MDVGVARIPFTLDQAVGHAGGITSKRVPAQRSADAPDDVVGRGGDPVLQAGEGFAIHDDDGEPIGKGIDQQLEGAGLAATRRTADQRVMAQVVDLDGDRRMGLVEPSAHRFRRWPMPVLARKRASQPGRRRFSGASGRWRAGTRQKKHGYLTRR